MDFTDIWVSLGNPYKTQLNEKPVISQNPVISMDKSILGYKLMQELQIRFLKKKFSLVYFGPSSPKLGKQEFLEHSKEPFLRELVTVKERQA